MKYKVEKFNERGIFLDQERVEADTPEAAIELAFFGVPHFYDRKQGEAYCHVTPSVEPPGVNEPCRRCGSRRSQCGGELNPHE